MKEIPKAIYKKGDVVAFQCYKAIKKGTIVPEIRPGGSWAFKP